MIQHFLYAFIILGFSLAQGNSYRLASASDNQKQARLTVISSGGEGVIFELETPDFEYIPGNDAQHLYQLLNVPGLEQSMESGKPQLPVKGVMIGVPADADFTLIIIEDENEYLRGVYNIQPVGIHEPMEDDFQPGETIYLPDESIYSSANPFPQEAAVMSEPMWIREQRVLQVSIYPFQYISAEKTLVWHKRLRIEVRFNFNSFDRQSTLSSLDKYEKIHNSSPFEAVFQSQLINYADARDWRMSYSAVSREGEQVQSITAGFNQTQSLGPRYKIVVDHDGIYRITRDELNDVYSTAAINPNNLVLTSQGRNVAITIENDNGNDTFDSGEAIVFYGQKFYGDYLADMYSAEDDLWLTYYRQLTDGSYVPWRPTNNAIMMEKYTDENVYWLTTGSGASRMPTVDGSPQGSPVPQTYTTTVHAEQSHHWYTYNFSSEDTWFWDNIRNQTTRTYTTTLSAIAATPFTATLKGEAVARVRSPSNPDHHNKIWFNTQTSPVVDNYWDGISRYHFSVHLPSSALIEGENQLRYQVLFDTNLNRDWIYFDWFEIEYLRKFQAENDVLQFSRNEGGLTWQYEIGNILSSKVFVLDITEPLTPTNILSATVSSGTVSFEGQVHSGDAEYIVAGDSAVQSPKSISYYTPPAPDLYAASNQADYIFITHSLFKSGAQALADYRAGQGLMTKVIDFDDLVNEFNFGIYHPIAIKNFLRYTFAHWQTPLPAYVLLIGDGHWNFKKYSGEYGRQTIYMPPFLAWVDPDQGEVDATNDLATIVGTDALPDLYIARLPVTSPSELNNFIQKVVAYEASPVQFWQGHFLFAADDTPDSAGNFVQTAENIINDYISLDYSAGRLYLDDYVDHAGVCDIYGDHSCIEATNDFIESLNEQGALIVNYIGHGEITFWADEVLLMKEDIT
ncbi:MAG: hypothetical protein GYA34_15765 [Chloroflexi bacterium]|nr:hypothetical protein [Chloroflexota bacterium]